MSILPRTKFDRLSQLVEEVQQTEHKFNLTGHPDRTYNPWMPYQPADFIGILWECLPEIKKNPMRDPSFLDVGCGPGTKMAIAEGLFGFNVLGIEIDPELMKEAEKSFPDKVAWRNALDFHGYDAIDVIWMYRPFRDPESQLKLEQKIHADMKPGAILAGASWEIDVAEFGWNPIVDDCLISPDGTQKIVRGAWQKPEGTADSWPKIIKTGIFAE